MTESDDTKLLNCLSDNPERQNLRGSFGSEGKAVNCWNCGNKYTAGHKQVCPVQSKSCNSSGKLNHFSKVCHSSAKPKPRFLPQKRSKDQKCDNCVHAMSEETQDSSDNEFTFTLLTNHNNLMEVIKTSRGMVIVAKINKTDVKLTLDSGATTNILDNATFDHIQNNGEHIQLLPTSIKIYPYDSKVPLPVQGKFEACLCNGLTTTSAMFYII